MVETHFFLLSIVIIFVCFVIAAWPRYFKRYFGVDTWRILAIADYIRIYKRYPTYLSEQYILQGKYDHPITLSAFLAIFPKKFIDTYQGFVSPAIEALHCFVLFLYVYKLTGDPRIALMAQLIYMLTPMVLMESSQLSTRSIGSLFFTLTWLPIMHFSFYGGWFYFVVALCMVTVLTFTHRMSTQVLVLMSLLMSIATFSPWCFLISCMGIGISWLCFGDKYKRILRGHLNILRYWITYIDFRYAHQVRGVPKSTQKFKQADIVRQVEQVFLRLPGISLFLPNIWMFFVLLVPLLPEYKKIFFGIFPHIYLWAILLFVLALATSVIKPLRFMGSGERYIEYSVFPVAVVASAGFSGTITNPPFELTSNWIIVIIGVVAMFGALLPALAMQYKVIIKDHNRSITSELWRIIDYLNVEGGKKEIRLACIPHQLADGILYFTKETKLYLTDSNEHINEMFEKWWPLIKRPLFKTLNDRQITHLLVNTSYVGLNELDISHRILREEGPYVLLMVNY
jgi:hypothetical protein